MTGPLTDRQLGKILALCRELGLTDRQQRLHEIGAYLYRNITSTRDLDRTEAGLVIDWLDRRTRGEALTETTGKPRQEAAFDG